MAEQQLIDKIYQQLELFKKSEASFGRRQFLSVAAKLYEIELRLSEITNSDEDYDISELEAMSEKIAEILS